MSIVEYCTILIYSFMIELFPIDEVCHFPIRHGEHAIHYKELPNFKYRHDFVRDVLLI